MARSRVINLDNIQQFTAINVLSDPGAIKGPVVIPQAAQIVITWAQDDGTSAHNVLYGRYSGAFSGTVAQMNSLMTALTTGAAWTAFAATMTTNSSFFSVSVRDVNTANLPIISSTNPAVFGTAAGTALPTEVAAVGTLRTDRVGPRYRGRIYLTNFATNAMGAGNVIAATAVTAINNWLATIAGAFTANGYTWVLGLRARAAYTGVSGAFHPARDAETRQISLASLRDNHWDSQRRRGLR